MANHPGRAVDQSQDVLVDPHNLGNLLVRMNVIARTTLLAALEQKRSDEKTGQLLLRLRLVTEEDIATALRAQSFYRRGNEIDGAGEINQYMTRRLDRSLSRSNLVLASYLGIPEKVPA